MLHPGRERLRIDGVRSLLVEDFLRPTKPDRDLLAWAVMPWRLCRYVSGRETYRRPCASPGLVRHISVDDVHPLRKRRVRGDDPPATIDDLRGVGHRRVGRGLGRSVGHGARHVGHAVVDHVLLNVARVVVVWSADSSQRCRPGRLRPGLERTPDPSARNVRG